MFSPTFVSSLYFAHECFVLGFTRYVLLKVRDKHCTWLIWNKLTYTNSDALLEFSNELPTDDYKIFWYGVKDDVYLFKI